MQGQRRVNEALDPARYTTVSACFGGVVWILYLVWHGIGNGFQGGWIERLFLLAPLVVLPLALWVIDHISDRGTGGLFQIAVYVQPLAAVSVVIAFALQRGGIAQLPVYADAAMWLTVPWLVVCGLLLFGEAGYVWRGPYHMIEDAMITVPILFLQVGGFWLMLDQMEVVFMGVTAPIRLLTGVHFHFTGFGALVLFVGLYELYVRAGYLNRAALTAFATTGAAVGIPLVAIGFVESDLIKTTGVIVLSISIVLGAILLYQSGRYITHRFYRVGVRSAAGCVMIGMGLAVVFQVSLHLGHPLLSIPTMTVTHGVLNGIGFLILGFLGVRSGLVEWKEEA